MSNYKVNPIDIPDEKTTFSPREWKYFLEELKMRGLMFTLEELRNF